MRTFLFILSFLLALLDFNPLIAQRPIASDPMYKQLRSMEDGPWEFSPEGYYYSWWMKKIKLPWPLPDIKTKVPGLGIHDRGFAGTGFLGDRYVSKYKPSAQVRAKMIALTEITRKEYEAIEKKYKDIGDREAVDATDRQVNIAIKIYEERFQAYYRNISSLCDFLERHTSRGAAQRFRDELSRIQANVSLIGKSYSRNSERSSAYLKELKNLERLSTSVKGLSKRVFFKQQIAQIKI